LFTGDSFYLGPIYLYRPETDLDAYVASMQKLAAMAPHLQLLLPSHNVPVADPSYLPKAVTAMQQVRRGEVKPVTKDGKREYVCSRTGDGCAPFADHRKEDGSGKESEDQPFVSHHINYPTVEGWYRCLQWGLRIETAIRIP
jgi:hypothetical protein